MENCEIIPLCKNSNVFVYNPKIDFFYKKLETSEYFSFPRQNHTFWDLVLEASTTIKVVPDNFHIIAKRMKAGNGKPRRWSVSENICEDLLWFVHSKKPKNLFYAISDVGFYSTELPPHEIDTRYKGKDLYGPGFGFRKKHELIKRLLPTDEIPFNGVIWRQYALTGQLQEFISNFKSKKIVIIGPWYFKDFGNRAKLQDYEFIEIDYYKAAEKYMETYEIILQKHFQDALYFIVGGFVGNWFSFKLSTVFTKSFIIDIGRALDIYYKELAKQMSWRWLL